MVDLLRYEYFNQGRLGADFYYQREQIELQGKLYQQALGDILTACRLAPEEVEYHAEAGSLYLRLRRMLPKPPNTASISIPTTLMAT